MIRVTVELISANTGQVEHLGTALIANDGIASRATSGRVGSYTVSLSPKGRPAAVWRRGHVLAFPRKRLLAWDLLYRALKNTVGDRNP